RAIAAVSGLNFSRETHRADIHAILIRVVEDAVLGVAAAAVRALEGDDRPGVRTGDRIVVDDKVRGQRALAAHGEGTIGRRTEAEVGGVVEHLAGFRRVAERVLEPDVRGQAVIRGDGAGAAAIHA